MQAVLHNQFGTISRGPGALLNQLKTLRPGVDPSAYVSFYSLRQEGRLANGRRITEQVYVHSKLLIVDDCVAVIGSANINDRSLSGERDSEVMAVVVDSTRVPSRMAGMPWEARGFAYSLRQRLWRQHLGLMEEATPSVDITDPVCASTYVVVVAQVVGLVGLLGTQRVRCAGTTTHGWPPQSPTLRTTRRHTRASLISRASHGHRSPPPPGTWQPRRAAVRGRRTCLSCGTRRSRTRQLLPRRQTAVRATPKALFWHQNAHAACWYAFRSLFAKARI